MGALIPWEPFKDLEDMKRRVSAWLGRSLRRREGEKEALTVAEWSPLVDIQESEKEYLVKAELPEMKKDDVKLSIQDDVLTIFGERKAEKEEEKGKKYHRVECCYGSFMRSFTLLADADGTKVLAEYKRGRVAHPSAKVRKGQTESD